MILSCLSSPAIRSDNLPTWRSNLKLFSPGATKPRHDIVKKALARLIKIYRVFVSPYLGGRCRFIPSCSQYALDCLDNLPAHRAVVYIFWRLLRCNPLCKGGLDPAPISISKDQKQGMGDCKKIENDSLNSTVYSLRPAAFNLRPPVSSR